MADCLLRVFVLVYTLGCILFGMWLESDYQMRKAEREEKARAESGTLGSDVAG